MKHYLFAILFAVAGSLAFAHEGHNDAPGSLKALHGGMVKQGKEFNLEVVSASGELKLYPLNHSGGDIPLAEVKVTATAQPPKGKSAPVSLETKDGAYYSKLDFKGAYRLNLEVKAEYKGKRDSFKVQVEQ